MATLQLQWQGMIILGIETSCDDTGVALLKSDSNTPVTLLANTVSSQAQQHAEYGGVYPSLARREHQKNLIPSLAQTLTTGNLLKKRKKPLPEKVRKEVAQLLERETELKPLFLDFISTYEAPNIDAIAITVGPGLEPCLWVGVNFAKAASIAWEKPTVPVNHVEAHLFAPFLTTDPMQLATMFPAVGLVVSGGHTQLSLIRTIGSYELLGETQDDAAGECFDKTARVLGLEYPGGPAIAAEAAKEKTNDEPKIELPRPMLQTNDYNFSFSGLKTAVLYDFKKRDAVEQKSATYIRAMSREIQQAVIDVLVAKTIKAAHEHGARSVILAGGVAANTELRKQLKKAVEGLDDTHYIVPEPNFCTDNAAMIALAGLHYFRQGHTTDAKELHALANLRMTT